MFQKVKVRAAHLPQAYCVLLEQSYHKILALSEITKATMGVGYLVTDPRGGLKDHTARCYLPCEKCAG